MCICHWQNSRLLFIYVVSSSGQCPHEGMSTQQKDVQMQFFISPPNLFFTLHVFCYVIIFFCCTKLIFYCGFFLNYYVFDNANLRSPECSFFSLACTLLAVLPSCLRLLTKPTFWQFKLALVSDLGLGEHRLSG